jgi:phage shock protein C
MTEVGHPAALDQQPRLRRSADDKVIAGVCGGLGSYFGTDPLWFRLGFVVTTLAGGAGVLIYLIAWLILPAALPGEALEARRSGQVSAGALIGGVALVALGLTLLADQFVPWLDQVIWPLAVVAAGVGLIYLGGRRHEHR